MKIIFKSTGTIILNSIALILFMLFLDNLFELIIGKFYSRLDIKAQWDLYIENKIVNYLVVTSLFSGLLSLIWQTAYKFSKNIFSLTFMLIVGILFLYVLNHFYWEYLQIMFSNGKMSHVERAFLENFGSLENTKTFFATFICIIFGAGILVTHLEYFFFENNKKIAKIAWHQIFSTGESFSSFLCFLTPMMIILSGYNSRYTQISIVHILLLMDVLNVLIFASLRIIDFFKLNRYYKDTLFYPERMWSLVIVHESPYVKKSFIYHKLFKNNEYMRRLDAEKIRLLPYDLHTIENCYIKLDIYDELMFIRNSSKRRKISATMAQINGIFNLAYCYDEDIAKEISHYYDATFSELDKTISKPILLNRYVDYRKKQIHIVSKLKIDKLMKTNCIVDEIASFKQYFQNHINEFLVFDYVIKWLEIVNYIYSLIAISTKEVPITPEISKWIEYGDFRKWRDFWNRIVSDEDYISLILKRDNSNLVVFQEFNWVWETVTSRTYNFQKYSIEELLEGAVKLRNYTRGHGVFTFDISQEINLKLINIVVFLINQLIDNHMLDSNFSNLESLGWVVYLGDMPYFLYSLNGEYKEYNFDSFQSGSSLALPIDIRE